MNYSPTAMILMMSEVLTLAAHVFDLYQHPLGSDLKAFFFWIRSLKI